MIHDRKPARGRAGGAAMLAASALLLCGFDFFRSENGDVSEGNRQLAAGKPEDALKSYNRAAKALPEEKGVHYNRGVALYKLGKYEEARKALLEATGAQDRALRQQAFYNLGNAQYQAKQYRDAADAYRRALRLAPEDRAAKWNLELALRQIREEEKKQKKKDQQQQDKDKQKEKDENKQQQQDKQQDKQQQDKQQQQKDKQQQQKDKQQQDKQQKDKQQQDKQQQKDKQQQQKDKQQQQKDKQQQKRSPRPQPRPEEQRMQRALDALDRGDKDLQRRRLRLLYGGRRRPTKDW